MVETTDIHSSKHSWEDVLGVEYKGVASRSSPLC